MHYYSTIDDILDNKYKLEYIVSIIKMILDDYISPQTIRLYVIRDNLTSRTPEWDNAVYLERKIPLFKINKWTESLSSKLLLPNLEALLKQNVCNFFIILTCKGRETGVGYHMELVVKKLITQSIHAKKIFFFIL